MKITTVVRVGGGDPPSSENFGFPSVFRTIRDLCPDVLHPCDLGFFNVSICVSSEDYSHLWHNSRTPLVFESQRIWHNSRTPETPQNVGEIWDS